MLKKADLIQMLSLVDDDSEIVLYNDKELVTLDSACYVGFKSYELVKAGLTDTDLETEVYEKVKNDNLPICFVLYTAEVGNKYDN